MLTKAVFKFQTPQCHFSFYQDCADTDEANMSMEAYMKLSVQQQADGRNV
jgi:hypothetical protein